MYEIKKKNGFLAIFFMAIVLCCCQRNASNKNFAEDEQLLERIKHQIEPGLESDCKWYKEIMEKIILEKKLILYPKDYYRLWINAYIYRDRKGAKIIGRYLENGGYSKFWRDCFYTLAEGQEKYPATLENFSEEDLYEEEIGTPLWYIFTYEELTKLNSLKVRLFLREMEESYKFESSQGYKIQPSTRKHPWTKADTFKWASSKPGDALYTTEAGPGAYTLFSIAYYAFQCCYYESAFKAYKESGRGNIILDYYAGYSYYLEKDPNNSSIFYLISDNGIANKLKINEEELSDSIKTIVKLSRERDTFGWLKEK